MSVDLRRLLEKLLTARPPRAGSLAISVFGDCIAEQGGSVWLGSLVGALAEFGLNARQVRTAMFRLVQDNWLSSEQRGRRSYYRLSRSGQGQYARAAARIYAAAPTAWNGEWTLVMPLGLEPVARDELRKRLAWLGFGVLSNGVLAHPRTDDQALAETLSELQLETQVALWQARPDNDDKLSGLVHDAWRLGERADRYRAFIDDFRVLAGLLERSPPVDERDAFVARILLIHEYRRLLLKTTDLPAALLPPQWPGLEAMQLVRRTYAALHAPASRYACSTLDNGAGSLPPPRPGFYRRFGGLERVGGQVDAA